MNVPTYLVLVLALAAPVSQSAAEEKAFVSGAKLNERCQSAELDARALCLGFVLGVVDENPAILRCAPPSVTAHEVVEALKLHLGRYPSDRAFPGHVIMRLAMREAWPCDP